MPEYKVTFASNVKLGTEVYRKGDSATISEELFESIEKLKLIEPKFEEIEQKAKTIEEMTVPELKKYAKDNDIDLGDAKKQKEILEAIQAAEEEKSDDDEDQTSPGE